MSVLLEQAIVDAKALKEAALKNAETTIIEKYSDEVKNTLNRLLEQDELGLGGLDAGPAAMAGPIGDIAQDVPLGAAEGEELCPCPEEDETSEITVDFEELAEALRSLKEDVEGPKELEETEEELEESEEVELNEEDLLSMLSDELSEQATDPGTFAGEEAEEDDDSGGAALAGAAAAEEADADAMTKAGLEESDDISEELIDAIVEKLTVDMGAELAGWAGRSSEDTKYQMEKELAHRRSTDIEEDLEALKKAQEELVFENKQLKGKLNNYKDVVRSLKENVQDVNLSNARLLYTNRVLRNTSLNERQKERIVEAISSAGSVEEAKMILETLQSTVQSTPKRSPQSLSEAITHRSSVLRASRGDSQSKSDPFSERLKKLAGIK
jgi:myosin heavy subunit